MQVLKGAKHEHAENKIRQNKESAKNYFLIGFFLLIFTVIFPLSLIGSVIAFAIALVYLQQNYSWTRGKSGEIQVAATLQQLDDSYYLLNDVVLDTKYGNIDHIVLGQNGIFVIETKHYNIGVGCNEDEWYLLTHSGKRRIQSISKQAKRNAKTLKDFIERHTVEAGLKSRYLFVNSIIAFVHPELTTKLYKPTVPVMKAYELPEFIKNVKTDARFSDSELKNYGDIILHHMHKSN